MIELPNDADSGGKSRHLFSVWEEVFFSILDYTMRYYLDLRCV
ncbi:hypothetical protein OXI21_02145 [Ignatzschineria sp. RMDPL8A]|nr:hypothetical protein [Ignatzschineria sp. RMDPL8A]MDG9729220.1 hypothetical protein [Ignatzschineria sp. RMDPL8A]